MPSLPTQSFTTIVNNTVAGIQGRANSLLNFSIGSTLRAIVEGFAGLFLWFQALVLQLLTACRLSTATGLDVDTFTVDFMPALSGSQTAALPNGSPRLGAQYATGQVTFARLTAGSNSIFIPAALSVGVDSNGNPKITNAGTNAAAEAQTNDLSQTFVVTADATFGTYSSVLGGYTLNAAVSSIIVPVQALVAGAAGNVQAGAVNTMISALPGIDTVTNVAAFINGANQESDSALKARFADYILGLSRGDYYGLQSSILGAGVTVQWTLTEGYNYDGSYHPGYFFVVADDGSGSPTAAFLQTITTAANAVRPLGIQCAVFSPVILIANVSMTITTATGYDHNFVVAQVAALIATNINSLGLGNSLPFSILASWAYSIPGVTSVQSVLLNGASGDQSTVSTKKLTVDRYGVINYATVKAGLVTVS